MSNLEIHNGSFREKVVAGKPSKKYLRIPSALEKLKKLQAIQFRYKKEFDSDQRLRAGFSAQQVREVIPEAVFEEDGYLMLDMDVLNSYVVEAKKELKELNKLK